MTDLLPREGTAHLPSPPSGGGAPWLYRALAAATLPVTLPIFALHPRLRGALGQRLGWLPRRAASFRGAIWYHGSSAGDVNALLPLAERSRGAHPVVVSAFTRAGAELLHARLQRQGSASEILPLRAPLELSPCVERFFELLRPRLLVLECLELWPTLLHTALRRRVPVAIVNGRLTLRSLARYRRWSALFAPLFAGLSQVTALDEEHAARFVAAGVPAPRVAVSTSTKHGRLPVHEEGRRGPTIVLGSLHAREAGALLPPLLAQLSGASVLVAPRYPRAAGAIARLVRRRGWTARRLRAGAPELGEVGILEGVGGLAAAYAGARIAFVGGSLLPRGGHNVIEAAAHGVPVVTGPHIDNCRREMALLQDAGAGHVAADADEVARLLVEARRRPDQRQAARWVAERLAASAEVVHQRLLELL